MYPGRQSHAPRCPQCHAFPAVVRGAGGMGKALQLFTALSGFLPHLGLPREMKKVVLESAHEPQPPHSCSRTSQPMAQQLVWRGAQLLGPAKGMSSLAGSGKEGGHPSAGLHCQSPEETAAFNSPGGACRRYPDESLALASLCGRHADLLSDAQLRARRPWVRCGLGRRRSQQRRELSCSPEGVE